MDGQLVRISVFYDGTFFQRVNEFYNFGHQRNSFLDLNGVQSFIRQKVADLETNGNASLCKIVEAHFFRGRFSLYSVKNRNNPQRQIEKDRLQDQLLMNAGVVAHYYPMNEYTDPPEEKGIDVWLALEAYDLAVHKGFDVFVLFAGDQDFVPLVKKINGLGIRVLIVGVDIDNNGKMTKTSQRLIDEASYTVMLSEEVDSKTAKRDAIVNGLFYSN